MQHTCLMRLATSLTEATPSTRRALNPAPATGASTNLKFPLNPRNLLFPFTRRRLYLFGRDRLFQLRASWGDAKLHIAPQIHRQPPRPIATIPIRRIRAPPPPNRR